MTFHRSFTLIGLSLALAFAAHAGPPLICHAYDIGAAKSLPWGHNPGSGSDNPDSNYDINHLAADTLKLLDSQTPMVVRMETLRRATIYGSHDQAAASELLAALRQRANGKPDALGYFDYGYFLASLKQLQFRYKDDLTGGADGYEYVRKALTLSSSPELELASAFVAMAR